MCTVGVCVGIVVWVPTANYIMGVCMGGTSRGTMHTLGSGGPWVGIMDETHTVYVYHMVGGLQCGRTKLLVFVKCKLFAGVQLVDNMILGVTHTNVAYVLHVLYLMVVPPDMSTDGWPLCVVLIPY